MRMMGLIAFLLLQGGPKDALFSESFEDDKFADRGWYDNGKAKITSGAIEYHWAKGGTTPDTSTGMRHLFEPSETVYVRYSLKLSKGWGWTGRAYHPHLSHFMTTENPK